MTEGIPPSRDLVRRVRAGFVLQGLTFNRWCRQHGVEPSSGRQALVGSWDGPKGRALRARIVRAARIQEAA